MSVIDPLRAALRALVAEAMTDALRVHNAGDALEARMRANRAETEADELRSDLDTARRELEAARRRLEAGDGADARWTDADYRRKYGGPGPAIPAGTGKTALVDDVPKTLKRQRVASEAKRQAALAREAAKRDAAAPPVRPADPHAARDAADKIAAIERTADRRDAHTAAGKATCPAIGCGAAPGAPCAGTARSNVFHPERYEAGRRLLERRDRALAIVCPTCSAAPGAFCEMNGKRGVHPARYPAAS